MGLREVSAILWRERHLLELLLFKLDEGGDLPMQNAVASFGSRYHQTEIMVDLQLQEVAYQAALGATARAPQPTLMDFLR